MTSLIPIGYAVVLVGAWLTADPRRVPAAAPSRRWPRATTAALLLVGVPTLLQLTVAPGLLDRLERRPGELTSEPWRLLTSLVVQDGGWAGAVYNLLALAVVGWAAERLLGPGRWWAVWLTAGVGAQFWGLVVQPTGGGNSVATFGLAGTLALLAVRRRDLRARLLGAAALLAGAVLLVLRDVHGGAVALGVLAGAVLIRSGADR